LKGELFERLGHCSLRGAKYGTQRGAKRGAKRRAKRRAFRMPEHQQHGITFLADSLSLHLISLTYLNTLSLQLLSVTFFPAERTC